VPSILPMCQSILKNCNFQSIVITDKRYPTSIHIQKKDTTHSTVDNSGSTRFLTKIINKAAELKALKKIS